MISKKTVRWHLTVLISETPNLEEMPGPIVKTQSELISAIKYSKKYEKEYGEFLMKYNRLDDGKAAERLVMQVIKDYEG